MRKVLSPEPYAVRWRLWLSLLALLAACDQPPDFRAWRVQRFVGFAHPAGGISEIVLNNVNGNIGITPWELDSISVALLLSATGLDSADAERCLAHVMVGESTAAGTLFLWGDVGDPGPRDAGVEFAILAPESIALNLRVEYGDISIQDLRGRLEADVTSGFVGVSRHAGSIIIRSTRGDVQCDLARLVPDDSIRIETGYRPLVPTTGRVTLALPGDVSARFDAEVTRRNTEHVIIDSFPELHLKIRKDAHKVGTIGAGEADIFIRAYEHGIDIENSDSRAAAPDGVR